MDRPKEGFNEFLGIRFCGGKNGVYQLEITVGPQHCHDENLLHGGVYLSLLDTVMSRAIRTLFEEPCYAPTMTLNAAFLRPIGAGVVYAEGKVVNQSQGTAFAEANLRDKSGRVLAKGSANFLLKKES